MKSVRMVVLAAMLAPGLSLAADVGVAVSVGQPGFYGHIEVGNFPQPRVIYREPVIIQPVPSGVVLAPIYLRVPPGHAKHWRKHCHKYNACGQPVYFVQNGWYRDVYVLQYREKHGKCLGLDDFALPIAAKAVGIALTSPDPVFFEQRRDELNGRLKIIGLTIVRGFAGENAFCQQSRDGVTPQRSLARV